jgi:hypothetical protein
MLNEVHYVAMPLRDNAGMHTGPHAKPRASEGVLVLRMRAGVAVWSMPLDTLR